MKGNDNLISMYLKDINKIPLLTFEEETELAKKAAKGDKKAKDKIVTSNLRFVINIAKKYQNKGIELEDLISEGNIGLLTAIEKFDVSKGYHFISYAVWWIRQSILKALSEKSRAIRLPLNRANELMQIEKTIRAISNNEINSTETENLEAVADILNMDVAQVKELININKDMISLESVVSERDNSTVLFGEILEDSNTITPEETLINTEMKNDLEKVMATLKPNEAKILKLRYGIGIEKPMSLKEIGDMYNLSKERIRQIENNAMSRMRHPTRARRLASYVA